MVAKNKPAETQDQKEFKARIKAERTDRGLSWAEMDMLLDERRMDVVTAPSSRPTASRMIEISRKLDGLPKPEEEKQAEPAHAEPVVDYTLAEKQRENLKPQLPPAEEQHAVVEVHQDDDVLEAAQDMIFDALGIDLDELKKLAPTIEKMIAARHLGLSVSLHIHGGDITL